MDQAAGRADGDFYSLPSSIHEILIVPDNGNVVPSDLENIVKEINATQVAPADKLTDSVYHYDSQTKIFKFGEKFVERQSERGERNIEKEEKDSLLDDLKAKKEEVTKTPKKDALEKAGKSKGGEAI